MSKHKTKTTALRALTDADLAAMAVTDADLTAMMVTDADLLAMIVTDADLDQVDPHDPPPGGGQNYRALGARTGWGLQTQNPKIPGI
jgi:hypothetical protein